MIPIASARRRSPGRTEADRGPHALERRTPHGAEHVRRTRSVERNLFLLMAANIAPLIVAAMLGRRLSSPLDGGALAKDGRRVLGDSKTWRGCAASLFATVAVGGLLNVAPRLAARFSLLSMSGDVFSSFWKRRIGIEVHGRSALLDQLPEAVLPLLLLRRRLATSRRDVFDAIFVFTVLEEPVSRLFFRFGLRDRPF